MVILNKFMCLMNQSSKFSYLTQLQVTYGSHRKYVHTLSDKSKFKDKEEIPIKGKVLKMDSKIKVYHNNSIVKETFINSTKFKCNFKKYKHYRNTADIKPYMNENRVYGLYPVSLALKASKRQFYHLYYRIGKHRKILDEIINKCETLKIKITEVNTKKLESLLGKDKVHQGVCLVASALPTLLYGNNEDDIFENWVREKNMKSADDVDIWLYLDKILDPQNFGAILRTAYYFGIKHVFTGVNFRCPITSTVSKASSGIVELMTIVEIRDSIAAISSLKSNGWKIVVAVPSGKKDCMPVHHYQHGQKSFIILGSEGSGVSSELEALADTNVFIPGKNECIVKSLNVSAATSVLLYSMTRI